MSSSRSAIEPIKRSTKSHEVSRIKVFISCGFVWFRGSCLLFSNKRFFLSIGLVSAFLLTWEIASSQQQHRTTGSALKTITITSEPNAIVWVDEIRRGLTDATGKLTLTTVTTGRHMLR